MNKAVTVKLQLLNAEKIKINKVRSVKLIFLAMNDFVRYVHFKPFHNKKSLC